MSRAIRNVMPDGYYSNKSKRENDKYDGLFSKKQMADLESETELKRTPINKTVLQKKLKDQKIEGCGHTMHTPFDLSDY